MNSIVIVVSVLMLLIGIVAPVIAGPDIDVAYISRTPRYEKYQGVEEGGLDEWDSGLGKLHVAPGQEKLQRWPKKGELVTFTATVKNMGDAPTGEFTYKWFFDGKEVASGKLASIKPGDKAAPTYQWKWDSEWNDHDIKFVADPDNKIKENVEANNAREDRTNALSYRVHIWQSTYDWFRTEAVKQNPNIGSFDDWIQDSLITPINNMFKESIYPTAPNGILERVRLDEVVVNPEDAPDPDPWACHAPMNLEWDCRWGFGPKEYPKIFVEECPWFVYEPYNWVMHEWTHQLGKIDIYQYFLSKDRNHVQPYGHLVTPANDIMTTTRSRQYSEMHASVFNYDLHKRRGTFGEYMYDLPRTCKVRVLDAYGNPIPNATIKFYEDHGHEVNAPEDFSGTADKNGVFSMPNRSVKGEETTATGHVMHDNPWGLLHLAGFNSLFFCDIKADGQTDYQYIETFPYNMAYRTGQTDTYTYDMQTTIVPGGRATKNNLFGVKSISKTRAYAVGAEGTVLEWNGKKWSLLPSLTGQTLYSIDADPKGETVCAAGPAGTVLICQKNSWKQNILESKANLTACAVVSPSIIIVGGERGQLFRSTDAGKTWSAVEGVENNIKTIRFASATGGIMVCDGSTSYYTTDSGATWTKSASDFKYSPFTKWEEKNKPIGVTLTDCSMASDTEAWVCSENGVLFKSTDGGKTWELFCDPQYKDKEPLLAIDMKPGGTGWSAGAFVKAYDTVPIKRIHWGMLSNEPVTTHGASDYVYDISCLTEDDAWLVGKRGLILHLQGFDWPEVKPHWQPK